MRIISFSVEINDDDDDDAVFPDFILTLRLYIRTSCPLSELM